MNEKVHVILLEAVLILMPSGGVTEVIDGNEGSVFTAFRVTVSEKLESGFVDVTRYSCSVSGDVSSRLESFGEGESLVVQGWQSTAVVESDDGRVQSFENLSVGVADGIWTAAQYAAL